MGTKTSGKYRSRMFRIWHGLTGTCINPLISYSRSLRILESYSSFLTGSVRGVTTTTHPCGELNKANRLFHHD